MAGKALIFSAPSGSGKTTIVKHLLQHNPDLGFSISASTRDKRGRTACREPEEDRIGLPRGKREFVLHFDPPRCVD